MLRLQTNPEKTASVEWTLVYHLFVCAIALTVMRSVSFNSVDADLWGHVLYGSEILDDGDVPTTTTHSFTATSYPWINHEILAELALAIGYRAFGIHGLLISKCAIGVTIFALMIKCARMQGAHILPLCILLVLVAKCLTLFFVLRPQVFSFALLALMLTVLTSVFRNWSTEEGALKQPACLWLLPPIFVVWANSHGGMLAGLGILIAYMAGRSIEAQRRLGIKSPRLIVRFLTVSIACVLAATLNPYGTGLLAWLVSSLSVPRPEIAEWCPIYSGVPGLGSFVILLGLSTTAILTAKGKRDWTHIGILIVLAWQSMLHFRHLAFFAIACGFWLPLQIESLLFRLALRIEPISSRLSSLCALPLVVAFVLSSVMGLATFQLVHSLRMLPVDGNEYPVDAIHFMHDNRIHGKAVVSFNWAQYAIAALPNLTVAFDGRYDTSYPQNVIDMNLDFVLGENKGKRYRSERSGPIYNAQVLTHCAPELVLMDRRFPASVYAMTTPESHYWVVLYQNAITQLWGRREIFDDPSSSRYFSPSRRMICNNPSKAVLNWPALPEGDQTL